MDLSDPCGVAAAFEGCLQEGLDDFACARFRQHARAERDHIQIVVLARQLGRVGIHNRRRANAVYLIGRDCHPDAGAAHEDAAIEPPARYAFGDRPGEVGIVHGMSVAGAEIFVGNAHLVEQAFERVLELIASVVRANCDLHARANCKGVWHLYIGFCCNFFDPRRDVVRICIRIDVKVPDPFTSGRAAVIVTAKGENRIRGGHPWVYRSDVADVRDVEPGVVVDVYGPRQRRLGRALFSDRSQITIRMIARDDQAVDDAFWRARLERAIAFRASLDIDATAYRLVHGEADLLPSLIVDRYDDYLVMQTLSQGMDRLTSTLTSLLVELTRAKGVLARNDPKVRQLEGLAQKVEVLHGTVPDSITVREARVTYTVDPWRGQKTGLFLDQRENREAAARYAHGRLLDCFSYNGGFALALAPKCDSVEALDVSADAVARIIANAAANGLANVTAREANVFDELRHLERDGARYDTIVLDPPAFAKNKASIPNALAGYKEINLRALRLLNPGGYLVTCSCSYNVDEAMFAEAVFDASADAHIPVTVVEKRMQGRDHPVLLGVPETYYLKSFILRKLT